MSESDKERLLSLQLVTESMPGLFDRRRNLDDDVALAGLKLLRLKYPQIRGLSSVLLALRPQDRTRNQQIAAELFHCYPSYHYVAAVLTTPNVVLYMASLKPGSEPKKQVVSQIEASFKLNKKYTIRSLLGQSQRLSDCLPFAVANLDVTLAGGDVSKVQFDTKLIRPHLVESLIKQELTYPHRKIRSRGNAVMYSRQLGN